MAAGIVDLEIEQGATFEKLISVKNPDGTDADYTGYTARMHIREDIDSKNFIIELTTENGRISININEITLYIDHVVTETINIDSGVYDLELISPTNKVTRLIKGKIKLSKEVTR